jgi:hypothetical protein
VLWVQSPTGMPATHGSCIGSGGRNRTCVGCVRQRSWDASNPYLNNRRASKELHPTSGLWRPVPRYEDRPKLEERGEPESHVRATHLPMLEEAGRVERSRPSRVFAGFKPSRAHRPISCTLTVAIRLPSAAGRFFCDNATPETDGYGLYRSL